MLFMHTDKLAHLTKAQQGQIASNTVFSFVQNCFGACANYAHAVAKGLNMSLRHNSIMPFLGGIFTGPIPIIIGGIMAAATTAFIFMTKKAQKKQAECRAEQQQEARAQHASRSEQEHTREAERISPMTTPAAAAVGGYHHRGGR